MTDLEQDLAALRALSTKLTGLAALTSMIHSSVMSPNAAASDTPSLTASRPVNDDTIPGLFDTIAKRFVAIGDFALQAGTRIASEDELHVAIATSGTLLPPGARR